ncbi:MAG: lytic transglycosylase domain-containing protein [Deltaproteobacteria bacterium]|nr:lytic transglycosylase domain-containing protein [Deltaproteobacteria bacterium]
MRAAKPKESLLVCFLILWVAVPIASADIYRYCDKNGVWHFSNIKSDPRYKLYIRSRPRRDELNVRDYDRIILQAARRFRVDPHLIRAVIKAESDFDRRAVSKKGARGLMQLMPETAYAMKVSNPFDPRENIIGGTRYLRLLLERFNQDKKLALAAYNAGPETVEAFNGIPPYPETMTYVKRVLTYYERFRSGIPTR